MTIFRNVNNFVFVGDDGMTPAMRLGFVRQLLNYNDNLWPEHWILHHKRWRRKGKVKPDLRRAA